MTKQAWLVFPATSRLTENQLILLAGFWLTAFGNFSFFEGVLQAYPANLTTLPALLSLTVVLFLANVLLLACICLPRLGTVSVGLILLLSSLAAAFMDIYGVVINGEMLTNALQTQAAEVRDLITPRLLLYLLLLGVLPGIGLRFINPAWRGWRSELLGRLKLISLALLTLLVIVYVFGSFYASFAREQKHLRSHANPGYWLYSLTKLAAQHYAQPAGPPLPHALDAQVPQTDLERELIILVVGETARADHFSLNGYARETNPLLRKAGVVSFSDFWACGTSTAAALPCMFADATLDAEPGKHENLLDALQHAGVNVLWLDNNSDSKGVALRAPYRNLRSPDNNPLCDEECRDEGMLVDVQAFIDTHPTGDIFIVLHQMGNHGPAYYRRYPPGFEQFRPVCRSNDLSQCAREEIINAYDNAILYTDHFLSKVIDLLQRHGKQFETGLFYVSDHGESLGEGGVYLHGMPKAVAPAAQLHVPALMWFPADGKDIDMVALARKREQRFSHDNIFHTVLGLMEIESSAYRPELDMLKDVRKPENQ